MNKLQRLLMIIATGVVIITIIVLNFVMNFNEIAYKITLWLIPAIAIVNLLLIAFFESKSDYKAGRFTLIMHISYAVVSVLFLYIERYFEGFDSRKILYYSLPIGIVLLIVIIFNILNIKLPSKKLELNTKKLKNNGQN